VIPTPRLRSVAVGGTRHDKNTGRKGKRREKKHLWWLRVEKKKKKGREEGEMRLRFLDGDYR